LAPTRCSHGRPGPALDGRPCRTAWSSRHRGDGWHQPVRLGASGVRSACGHVSRRELADRHARAVPRRSDATSRARSGPVWATPCQQRCGLMAGDGPRHGSQPWTRLNRVGYPGGYLV
jgi:hypothetical protein